MILKLCRSSITFRSNMPCSLVVMDQPGSLRCYRRPKFGLLEEYKMTQEIDEIFPRGKFAIYVDGDITKSGTLRVYRRVGDQEF